MVFGVTGGEAISLRGGLDEPSSSSAAAGHAFALSSAPPKASSASTATTTATTNAVASQQPTLPSPASRHWHIISAPGHTDHMYLLYFPRGRLLYVSDMMILNNGYFKRLKRKRGAESRAKMAAAMARAHGAVAGAFEDARRLRKEKKGGKKKRLGLMGRISMLMTSVESEGAAAAKNTTAKGAAAAAATTPSSTTNAASSPAASATAASTTIASSRAAKRRAHHYANNANAYFWWSPFFKRPPFKVSAPVPIEVPPAYYSSLALLRHLDVRTLAFPHGEVVPVEFLTGTFDAVPSSPSSADSAATSAVSTATAEERQRAAWQGILDECAAKGRLRMFARTWLCGFNTVLKDKRRMVEMGLLDPPPLPPPSSMQSKAPPSVSTSPATAAVAAAAADSRH